MVYISGSKNIIVLTSNTVSHFQCGIHQCHNKRYRPDDFCSWWWFGTHQKSKSMYTCSTCKFSQYFEDHHFKLKLNRNAGWYKRLILFCTLVTFGIFCPNSICEKNLGANKWKTWNQRHYCYFNFKSWWNKRAFIFIKKNLAPKIYLICFLDTNPQK